MASPGVESARVTFPWTALEPRRNEFDFDRTDRTVAAAAKHRVDVLPVILYTPYWARVNKRNPYSPPRRTSDFTRADARLIRRYGSNGSASGARTPACPSARSATGRSGTSPTTTSSATGTLRARARTRGRAATRALLQAAHKTIHREDRSARTVLGGITGIAWLDLRRCTGAGVRNNFDVAALQVYPETVQQRDRGARADAGELVRARDKDVRLWVTEVAFPAARRARPSRSSSSASRPTREWPAA